MATMKPLSAADNLPALGAQMQARDRLRAQPKEQEAVDALHQLANERRITIGELRQARLSHSFLDT